MAFKKMNPTFKKKWLKALRTPPEEGGYLQLDGKLVGEFDASYPHSSYLKDIGLPLPPLNLTKFQNCDAFCCLGVASNLLIEDGTLTDGWDTNFFDEDHGIRLVHMGMPPKEVLDPMGLTNKSAGRLAELNDDGKSFAEIADWIEAKL